MRRIGRCCAWLGLGALLAGPAHASDCGERLVPWLQAAYPQVLEEASGSGAVLRLPEGRRRWIELDEVACKVWPGAPDKTLLAVLLRDSPPQASDGYEADLEVLVADSRQPRILQRHRQAGAVTSDAIRVSGVALDTARYDLGPARAFGVRVSYSGSSRANPLAITTLSLYEPAGDALRRVLVDLVVSRSSGEWDGVCDGRFEEATATVALEEHRDHGYRRLRIDGLQRVSRQVAEDGECDAQDEPPVPTRDWLRHDGVQYGVPAGLRWGN